MKNLWPPALSLAFNLPWKKILFWVFLILVLLGVAFVCFVKFMMDDICSYGGSPYCS